MIRVLLADDRETLRASVAQFLGNYDDVTVVGLASDGRAAVELSRETNPDVVLMDLVMPGMDGIEATREILAFRPDTRVIMFTMFSERERVLEAVDAGAIGYLLKESDPRELLLGIRAAFQGQPVFGPEAARALESRSQ